MITELNDRSREIFRRIVDGYLETGEPVGSRTLSKMSGLGVSPATIRNVMADLEELGLLYAPHTSAGRMPTDLGLRLFVDGLMEVGGLSEDEKSAIETQFGDSGFTAQEMMEKASATLSGLSACAGLVVAPKANKPLKQIEFVNLGPGRALVVLVSEDGMIENRVIDLPRDISAAALVTASNYLNAQINGKTLEEARRDIQRDIQDKRIQLDEASTHVVETGLASKAAEDSSEDGYLIVRGHMNLLEDISAVEELENIRKLFQVLEAKETMSKLIEETSQGEGVQIFIGRESTVFEHSGWSVVASSYGNPNNEIVGAIGVIGPTRLNYGRIIPIVDYTSKVMGRLLGGGGK